MYIDTLLWNREYLPDMYTKFVEHVAYLFLEKMEGMEDAKDN